MSSNHLSELPILESCEGCSACCQFQGAPPDYVALSMNPHFFEDPSFAEDVVRFRALQGDAFERLQSYLEADAQGAAEQNGHCVWLNDEKTGCQFYDQRPSTCRVFERSSPGCHYYRRLLDES